MQHCRTDYLCGSIFYVLGKQPAAGGESCTVGFFMCQESKMFRYVPKPTPSVCGMRRRSLNAVNEKG